MFITKLHSIETPLVDYDRGIRVPVQYYEIWSFLGAVTKALAETKLTEFTVDVANRTLKPVGDVVDIKTILDSAAEAVMVDKPFRLEIETSTYRPHLSSVVVAGHIIDRATGDTLFGSELVYLSFKLQRLEETTAEDEALLNALFDVYEEDRQPLRYCGRGVAANLNDVPISVCYSDNDKIRCYWLEGYSDGDGYAAITPLLPRVRKDI